MSNALFPGELLRKRREELGLAPTDVYAHIRVPAEYVIALETSNLDALPIPTYAIGFLGSYCNLLGLEPEFFVDRFRTAMQSTADGMSSSPARQKAPTPQPKPHAPWKADLITWGAICGFVVLGWVAYSAIIRPFAQESGERVEAGTVEITLPEIHLDRMEEH